MEVSEVMDCRSPLAALSSSQHNTNNDGDVDFSKLTPSQFGISTESFLSSAKIKDKSRVAQLKARRRSTIGVRGSPETNSLICFRAKQAAKTPPRTPQLSQGSPFLSRCDSLKKKMAAFQCLMEEEEEDEKSARRQIEEDERAESTLASTGCLVGKENSLTTQSPISVMMPPPSKKRCRALPGECEDNITERPLPCPTLATQQEQEVRCTESENQRPLPASDLDAKNKLLSLPMILSPDIKLMVTDENEISVRKKKRVRFGAPLSPEFFDKTLPPSTPLQKGGTPMCPPSSTGPKRSLLKTPQRSEPRLPQPDFSSPQSNGASPVLVIDRHNTGLVYSDDVFTEVEKISFPSMEEESLSERPSGNCEDAVSAEEPGQPQAEDTEVMNAAFQEDVPSEKRPASPTGDQRRALSKVDLELEFAGSSEQLQDLSSKPSSQAARSRSRKRKQPGESEPEKRRSSRSAAASASGKMKTTSGVKRKFGSKEVDRSLYGKRNYASKNPLLSPIYETMSSTLNSTPAQPLSESITDGEQDCIQTPSIHHSETDSTEAKRCCPQADENAAESTLANEDEQILTCVETDTTVNQSDVCLEPSVSAHRRGSKAAKVKRNSVRSTRQRRSSGTVKRKGLGISAVSSTAESESESGDHGTESQETDAAGLGPLNQDNPDEPVLNGPERSENEEAETLVSCEAQQERNDTLTTVPNEDAMTTDKIEQKTPNVKRRGRVPKAQKSPHVKMDAVVEDVDEDIKSERITCENQREEEKRIQDHSQPSNIDESKWSESKAEPAEPDLAPWQQADFCIDDILKPVVKSRGSVRRSLRNRRSVDLQAVGLAWVDHTSPELSKASRRKTRSRLSGVSEPPQSLASEEPLENPGE